MSDSIFTKIIRGEIPADILYQDDLCIVIRDIHPQAPTHLLIIPKKPLISLAEAEKEDQALLGHLLLTASHLAKKMGLEQGFRLVANNGRAAGQSVFHLHFHLLAGKTFKEAGLNQ